MQQINAKQIIVMIMSALAFIAAATSQMEPLIGIAAAKSVSGLAAFIGGLMAAMLTPYLSNSNVVLDAKAQKGVDIFVSREADAKIAAIAIDPDQDSIQPAPGEAAAVTQKANAA